MKLQCGWVFMQREVMKEIVEINQFVWTLIPYVLDFKLRTFCFNVSVTGLIYFYLSVVLIQIYLI